MGDLVRRGETDRRGERSSTGVILLDRVRLRPRDGERAGEGVREGI